MENMNISNQPSNLWMIFPSYSGNNISRLKIYFLTFRGKDADHKNEA